MTASRQFCAGWPVFARGQLRAADGTLLGEMVRDDTGRISFALDPSCEILSLEEARAIADYLNTLERRDRRG